MFTVAHRTPPTSAGCQAFATAGASVFEVDLQVNGDDPAQLVVSHYLPVGASGGWIERDNRRFRRRRSPSPDPDLAAVIDRIPADCDLLLDPKETRPDRRAALVATLSTGAVDPARCIVSSIYEGDLKALQGNGFRTWLTIKDETQLRAALDRRGLDHGGVSIRQRLLQRDSMAALRAITPVVVAWTVNEVDRAAQLKDLGVAGITTDNPEVMKTLSES